jgi:hypothetical protein
MQRRLGRLEDRLELESSLLKAGLAEIFVAFGQEIEHYNRSRNLFCEKIDARSCRVDA